MNQALRNSPRRTLGGSANVWLHKCIKRLLKAVLNLDRRLARPRPDADHGPMGPVPPRVPQDQGKWSTARPPVAFETSVTPPRPRGRVSDATNRRRLFSSRCGERASNRRRMLSIVSMPRVNHISIPGEIPQRQKDSPASQPTPGVCLCCLRTFAGSTRKISRTLPRPGPVSVSCLNQEVPVTASRRFPGASFYCAGM